MNKIAIIYISTHHGNTKKVLDSMNKDKKIDLIKIQDLKEATLKNYTYIGFASGIYYQTLAKPIINLIEKIDFQGQKVFIIYTCGMKIKNYVKKLENKIKKQTSFLGTYSCRGYDTFGPWKMIGGIAKKHPNQKDLKKAKEFIDKIIR